MYSPRSARRLLTRNARGLRPPCSFVSSQLSISSQRSTFRGAASYWWNPAPPTPATKTRILVHPVSIVSREKKQEDVAGGSRTPEHIFFVKTVCITNTPPPPPTGVTAFPFQKQRRHEPMPSPHFVFIPRALQPSKPWGRTLLRDSSAGRKLQNPWGRTHPLPTSSWRLSHPCVNPVGHYPNIILQLLQLGHATPILMPRPAPPILPKVCMCAVDHAALAETQTSSSLAPSTVVGSATRHSSSSFLSEYWPFAASPEIQPHRSEAFYRPCRRHGRCLLQLIVGPTPRLQQLVPSACQGLYSVKTGHYVPWLVRPRAGMIVRNPCRRIPHAWTDERVLYVWRIGFVVCNTECPQDFASRPSYSDRFVRGTYVRRRSYCNAISPPVVPEPSDDDASLNRSNAPLLATSWPCSGCVSSRPW